MVLVVGATARPGSDSIKLWVAVPALNVRHKRINATALFAYAVIDGMNTGNAEDNLEASDHMNT